MTSVVSSLVRFLFEPQHCLPGELIMLLALLLHKTKKMFELRIFGDNQVEVDLSCGLIEMYAFVYFPYCLFILS